MQAQSEIKIGVLAKRGAEKAFEQWGPTAKAISEKLSRPATIVPLKFIEIEPALANQQIHFLIANSGFYAKKKKKYNLKALNTKVINKIDLKQKKEYPGRSYNCQSNNHQNP